MTEKIVFVDGFCVLCNGLANYILKYNRNSDISIASLQGSTAKELLPSSTREELNTVVYLRNDQLLEKSTAVLHLISDIGGWRKLFKVFFIIPRPIRDWLYEIVSQRRYRWFGKNEVCRLPNVSDKQRILD